MSSRENEEFQEYTRPRGVLPWVIEGDDKILKLTYSPHKGAQFIDYETREDLVCELAGGVFCIRREDVLDAMSSQIASRSIAIGRTNKEWPDYYRIEGRILGIDHHVYIGKEAEVDIGWFFPVKVNAKRSIFQKIDRLISEDVYIGGPSENAIPLGYWKWLLFNIPGRTEVDHYVEARMQELFSDYLPTVKDGEGALKKLLAKWPKGDLKKRRQVGFDLAAAYDKEKFGYLYSQLQAMLADSGTYEAQWEAMIVKFICILYPRYIRCIRQLKVPEKFTKQGNVVVRRLDITLLDADGHIDLIEIKRPSVGPIFRKMQDHDNNILGLELQKTLMQIEKYVLYLQKGGYALEQALNKQHPNLLPNGTLLKIINPKGLVIFGRSNEFTPSQREDFEVIRRRYANIADIMTYDDLLARLRNVMDSFVLE